MIQFFEAWHEIVLTDKIVLDLWIYGFSFLAFAFLPKQLGKYIWWALAWFCLLNILLIMQLPWLTPWTSTVIFFLFSQLPWIVFLGSLRFPKSVTRKCIELPMRQILFWHITRLMGFHFAAALWGGYVHEEFGLGVGLSETLTGLGALILLAFYRPEQNFFRLLLLFWNTYGLTSVISALYKGFFSNPNLPMNMYSREIFRYICDFPQAWDYFFWFPMAVIFHLALFFKLYSGKEKAWT